MGYLDINNIIFLFKKIDPIPGTSSNHNKNTHESHLRIVPTDDFKKITDSKNLITIDITGWHLITSGREQKFILVMSPNLMKKSLLLVFPSLYCCRYWKDISGYLCGQTGSSDLAQSPPQLMPRYSKCSIISPTKFVMQVFHRIWLSIFSHGTQ